MKFDDAIELNKKEKKQSYDEIVKRNINLDMYENNKCDKKCKCNRDKERKLRYSHSAAKITDNIFELTTSL